MPSLPARRAGNLAHAIFVAAGRYHVMETSLAVDALMLASHVPIRKYSAATSGYLDSLSN
jgi:hypothetical protein